MGKKRICSLSGLKVLALVSIFWTHTWAVKPQIGLTWAVDFFFCCSGFLIAYRYFDDERWSGFETSVSYLRRKLAVIWPIHIVSFFLTLIASGHKVYTNWDGLQRAIPNLLLLQAWGGTTKDLAYSFNGVTWFLSALLFCYFMAPLLIVVVRRARSAWVLFAFVFAAFVFLYDMEMKFHEGYFGIDLYTSPVLRCLQFFFAMCAYPLFVRLQSASERLRATLGGRWILTAAEVVAIALLTVTATAPIYWMYTQYMPMLTIPAILIFSLEGGFLSRLLGSAPLMALAAWELEFYVFHSSALRLLTKHLRAIQVNVWIFNIEALLITAFYCWLYRRYISKWATDVLSRGLARVESWAFRPKES